MPTVSRQSNAQVRHQPEVRRTGGVLDRAVDVASHEGGGLKVCLYGRNGTGKTTLACKFPKPLLLLGFEDGTRSVRNVPGVKFLRVSNTADIDGVIAELPSSGYRTVVLDTLTSLQDVIFAEVLKLDRAPVQLSWGKFPREVYFTRAERLKEAVRKFFDLAERSPINFVFLAQEKDHSKKDEESASSASTEYDHLLVPFIGAGIGKSAAGYVHEGCDFVLQTFAREQVIKKREEIAPGEMVDREYRTGKPEFCLRTQRSNPVYAAKIRADEKAQIPDIIVNPTWESLRPIFYGK